MTSVGTLTLSDFLLARIAEDEAVAEAAGSGAWHWDHGTGEMCNERDCPFGTLVQAKDDGRLYELMDVHGYDVAKPWQGAAHIARHDPARVLADCRAKRRIVELNEYAYDDHPYRYCLRLLALPYADHPDYDESWRL